MKQFLDFLPLVVFFAFYKIYDIYAATAALIVATAQRREGELSHTFAELERIWDKYEVYRKAETL